MAESLKCQVCNKAATVHLTQIVNNKIHKVDLCEECAHSKGVTDPDGLSLADLLTQTTIAAGDGEAGIECDVCGFSAADFRSSGRLGCPACYGKFESQIRPMLKNMHRGQRHEGKVPERSLRRTGARHRLGDLERCLRDAIIDERYEDAAGLRDEIRTLANNIDGGGRG